MFHPNLGFISLLDAFVAKWMISVRVEPEVLGLKPSDTNKFFGYVGSEGTGI